MKQIRIMVIDPRQLVREGFEKLLRRPLFNVVTTGRTLEDAFNSADMAQADIVILSHSTEAEIEAQMLPSATCRPGRTGRVSCS